MVDQPATAGPHHGRRALARWSTTAALLLAGASAGVGAALIAGADDGTDRWRAVIVLWGVAPAFVAWETVHGERSAQARVPVLWLAIFPAALAAVFSYLLLAPSLALMLIAAVRTSAAGLPRGVGQALRSVVGGLLFVAGWGAGFLALFARDDPRCRSTPISVSCASDVITGPEAAIACALLAGGVAAVLLLTRRR